MLHNLGIMSFQQIAHWSERDIDDFDARLPEFPGRIRRDQWVTQARSLHQAKYGDGATGLRPDGRRP
jgi:predicted flap endonuclease-1-like 5' DNA nuclease